MGIMADIREDYESKKSLKAIDVPEWKTKVYFYPVMTVREQTQVLASMMDGEKINYEGMLTNVMLRARDESGTLLFRTIDRRELMNNADSSVITRISAEMGFVSGSIEESEKN